MDPPACSLCSDTLGLRGPECSRMLTDIGSVRIMGIYQKNRVRNQAVGKG